MCAEGQYGNGLVLGCIFCANASSRKDGANPTVCPVCSPGLYQPEKGQGSCRICGAGKYQEKYNTTSCLLCPSGFSREEIISFKKTPDVDPTVCYPCQAGETTLSNGMSRCSGCIVGKYGYTLEDGQQHATGGYCRFCRPGMFQDSKGKTKCLQCPKDSYVETNGSVARGNCQLCTTTYALHTTTSEQVGVDNKTSGCICAKAKPESTTTLDRAGYYTEQFSEEEISNPVVADRKLCLPCPSGAACYHDGMSLTDLHSQIGYWRPSINSTIFSDCSKGIKGVNRVAIARQRCCPYGRCEQFYNSTMKTFNTTDDQCLTGYGGELCLVCATNSVKIGTECVACQGGASLPFALVASFCLWTIPVMLFIVARDVCLQCVRRKRKLQTRGQNRDKIVPYSVATTSATAAATTNEIEDTLYSFVASFVELGVNEAIVSHLKTKKITVVQKTKLLNTTTQKITMVAGQIFQLIQFMQMIHCLFIVLDYVPWVSSFASVMVVFGLSNLDLFSLIELVQGFAPFKSWCHLSVPFLERWILYTLMPLVMAVCVYLAYACVRCYSRRGVGCTCCVKRSQVTFEQLPHNRTRTLIFVWLFIYPSTITRMFGVFRCTQIEGVQGWVLESDIAFQCYKGIHWVYMGFSIVASLLFGLGFPLYLLSIVCKKNRNKSSSISSTNINIKSHLNFQRAYGDVFLHLDADGWWFVPVSMLHTFVLVGTLQIVGFGRHGQSIIACLLQLGILLLTLKRAPFLNSIDNRSHFVSSLTIMLVVLCGFALLVDLPTAQHPTITFSEDFMTTCLLSLLAAHFMFTTATSIHILFADKVYTLYTQCIRKCIQICQRKNRVVLPPLCYSPPQLKDEDFLGFPPSSFCPISLTLMHDPWIDIDGFSYEKKAIFKWIEEYGGASPITRRILLPEDLKPNRMLKDLIDELIEAKNQQIKNEERKRNELIAAKNQQMKDAEIIRKEEERLKKVQQDAEADLRAALLSKEADDLERSLRREQERVEKERKNAETELRAALLSGNNVERIQQGIVRCRECVLFNELDTLINEAEEYLIRKQKANESQMKLNEGLFIVKGLEESKKKAKVNMLLKERSNKKKKFGRRRMSISGPTTKYFRETMTEEDIAAQKARKEQQEQEAEDERIQISAKREEQKRIEKEKQRVHEEAMKKAQEMEDKRKEQLALRLAKEEAKRRDAANNPKPPPPRAKSDDMHDTMMGDTMTLVAGMTNLKANTKAHKLLRQRTEKKDGAKQRMRRKF